MHAASVHPEPGSNSRKICIKTAFADLIVFRAWLLFTFCLSSILFKNCEICFTHGFDLSKPCFVLISYCSIFNDRLLLWPAFLLQSCAALVLYHFISTLSIPFLKKVSIFFGFFCFAKNCLMEGEKRQKILKCGVLSVVQLFLRGTEPSQTPKFLSPASPWLLGWLRDLLQFFLGGRSCSTSNAEVFRPPRLPPSLAWPKFLSPDSLA